MAMLEYKYLVMVTTGNNNKYYKMFPNGDNFDVEYGRIGVAKCQKASYHISQWDKKYNEKIKKGYVDRSNLIEELIIKNNRKDKKYIDIGNKVIAKIVNRLQSMAKQSIEDNYTISSNRVTQKMIAEAQISLNHLLNINDLNIFNEKLIELFSIIPRKMSKVSDHIAKSNKDYGRIIDREQNLLDVMKGQVAQSDIIDKNNSNIYECENITILDALGLKFDEVNDDDIKLIKKSLGKCSHYFKQAWKISNSKTEKMFNEFVKHEGNIETKLLWHGSRNENWWSIINSGLKLKPTNVVITGKMFGYGTYFATKSKKAIGYTSLSGSYWARGTSNTAFISLYEVAYGTPYDVYQFDSKFYDLNYNNLQKLKKGVHCLHAHEGSMLKNDEIVVYREEQTTIKYLVEISN